MGKKYEITIKLSRKERKMIGENIISRKIKVIFREGEKTKITSSNKATVTITEIKCPEHPPELGKRQIGEFLSIVSIAKIQFTDHDCPERDECLKAIEHKGWWGMSCENCSLFKGGSTWEE